MTRKMRKCATYYGSRDILTMITKLRRCVASAAVKVGIAKPSASFRRRRKRVICADTNLTSRATVHTACVSTVSPQGIKAATVRTRVVPAETLKSDAVSDVENPVTWSLIACTDLTRAILRRFTVTCVGPKDTSAARRKTLYLLDYRVAVDAAATATSILHARTRGEASVVVPHLILRVFIAANAVTSLANVRVKTTRAAAQEHRWTFRVRLRRLASVQVVEAAGAAVAERQSTQSIAAEAEEAEVAGAAVAVARRDVGESHCRCIVKHIAS